MATRLVGRRMAAVGLVALVLLSAPVLPARGALAAANSPDEAHATAGTADSTTGGLADPAAPVDPAVKEVLAQLFALNRAQEEAKAQIERLAGEVSEARSEQAAAAAQRDALVVRRQQQMARFGSRLRYYHEESALAPIAFLLASQSFMEFLRRLEIWTDILDADARLLADLRQLKDDMTIQEEALAKKQAALSQLLHESQAESDTLAAEIAQKEAILAGLQSKRAEVEAQLAQLEQNWETKAKPVLMALGTSLQTVSVADFQPDSMKASLFPPGVEARFSAESLNRLLQSKANLKGLAVKVAAEQVNLEGVFDGTQLKITGHFVLSGQTRLRYTPDAITIDAIKVPDDVTKQILESGELDIDMSPILGPWALKDVHMEEQQLVIRAGVK